MTRSVAAAGNKTSHKYKALQSTKRDEEAGKDDLILKFDFEASPERLCGDYADLPSVRAGLCVGMKMRVPQKMVQHSASNPRLPSTSQLSTGLSTCSRKGPLPARLPCASL